MDDKQQKLQDVIQKKKELLTKIKTNYLSRLSSLLDTGFTGNIQINCNQGFPINHNVNYTISITEHERKQIIDVLEEEKQLKHRED